MMVARLSISFFAIANTFSYAGKENKCARTRDVTRGDKYSKEISMEGVVTHTERHMTPNAFAIIQPFLPKQKHML